MFQSILHTFLSFPIAFSRNCWIFIFSIALTLIHIIFFDGILDIYFTSPVVQGIPEVARPSTPPPAHRVFLIVIDGLNADVLFDKHIDHTPFLRHVVKKRGVAGISIARTPTLSRPGHLALMSGVYEYMHGLTRPPTENNFDSVVNRSKSAFLFGEWEVVDLFALASKSKVHGFSYPHDFNDFSMPNPAVLDQWVFDHLINVVTNSTSNPDVNSKPTFFLLHLLGVDTFSHSHATEGEGLARVIAQVDAGIAKLEAAVEDAFGHDGKTTYIVTSDHGMSSWSAHGAGDTPEETRTPLLAWGAGIRSRNHGFHSKPVISQVDVCAMISGLLGLNFPVHSVGKVPLHLLKVPWPSELQMMRANAKQIIAQFLAVRQTVKSRSLSVFFREFPDLDPTMIKSRLAAVDGTGDQRTDDIIKAFSKLVNDATNGIYFYHHYNRQFRKTCLTAIFFLLLFACFLSCLRSWGSVDGSVPVYEIIIFTVISLVFTVFLIIDRRPLREWIYTFLLIYLLWGVYRQVGLFKGVFHLSYKSLIFMLVSTELLVLALSLSRQVTALVLVLHLIYDFVVTDQSLHSSPSAKIFVLGGLFQAVFPLMPSIGWSVCYPLVYAGPALTLVVTIALLRRRSWECCSKAVMIVVILQTVLVTVSCWNHYRTHSSVNAGLGMPWGTTVITKCLLLSSAVAVIFVGRRASTDVFLLSLTLTATSSLTLFSLFTETLFLFSLFLTLGAWVSLHRGHRQPYFVQLWTESSGVLPDNCGKSMGDMNGKWVYYTACSMLYVCSSCIGIGNIVSISSYDPHVVLCFQGVFDLNVMTLVVFLKDSVPVMLVTAHFVALMPNVSRPQILRMFVLSSGVVTFQLLFMIRDQLPWTTFASQINHFTCNLLYIAFTFIIYTTISVIMPESNFQII